MQDRPTAIELLDALEAFMRDRSANARDRWERFQFQVAANTLGILRREAVMEEDFVRREWHGLDGLLGKEPVPVAYHDLLTRLEERNHALVEAIKRGDFDAPDREAPLLRHLYETVVNKVRIASPREAPPSPTPDDRTL